MQTTQRDTRLDALRAICLLMIFIDHVPGTIFEELTIRNFGFADAAEAFVLISGIALGLAYAPKFANGQKVLTTLKIWRRAVQLYCAHIMTTVITLTIFCGAALLFNRPWLLRWNNIENVIDNTPQAIVGIGLMGHQLGYNNILSMYAVVLLLAPAMLWLMQRSMTLTLMLSFAIWMLSGIYQFAPPNYPTEGYWFLNPFSWQFLFVIGMALTVHVKRGGKLPSSPIWSLVAAAYVVGAFVWVHSPMWGQQGWMGLPLFLAGFDKTFLALPRLLNVLALAYLITQIPQLSRMLRVGIDHPLAVIGRHSLSIFIFGTVLAMFGQVAKSFYGRSEFNDLMIVAVGVTAQLALAYSMDLVAKLKKGAIVPAGAKPAYATVRPATLEEKIGAVAQR